MDREAILLLQNYYNLEVSIKNFSKGDKYPIKCPIQSQNSSILKSPQRSEAHTQLSLHLTLSYKPSYRKGSSDSMQGYSGFKKDRILAGKAPQ